MNLKTLFFDFEGRIGRKDYWLGLAIAWTVFVAGRFIPDYGWIVCLPALYCLFCLVAKRLHDAGRSGTFVLAPMILGTVLTPAVSAWSGLRPDTYNDADAQTLPVMLAGLAINILFALWVSAGRPEEGPNEYGLPRPRSLFSRSPEAGPPVQPS